MHRSHHHPASLSVNHLPVSQTSLSCQPGLDSLAGQLCCLIGLDRYHVVVILLQAKALCRITACLTSPLTILCHCICVLQAMWANPTSLVQQLLQDAVMELEDTLSASLAMTGTLADTAGPLLQAYSNSPGASTTTTTTTELCHCMSFKPTSSPCCVTACPVCRPCGLT